MKTKTQPTNDTTNREIAMSRILNAPRELVWEVWTNPEHIDKWWGPNGFSNTIHKMEVHSGGEWNFIMHGPDGKDYPNEIIYTEVVKPERIVYTHVFPKFDTTVTFEKLGDKTKLTMIMVFPTVQERDTVVKEYGAIEGQKQTFARLEEYLTKQSADTGLVITRTFNAPRKLIYKAFSEAEALAQWWGPKGSSINVTRLDFRPGGMFHYCMKSPFGEMWGKFQYLEMMEPERIVFINSFSDKDGNVTRAPFSPTFPLEVMNFLTLTEHEGKTKLTLRGGPLNASEMEHQTFSSMYSGMQQGFGGTFDQLEEYLSKNQ